jgi:hypothetical protein
MRRLLLLLMLLVLAPPAQAATVAVESDSGQVDEETGDTILESTGTISVLDSAGEVNDLRVRSAGNAFFVEDRAAALTAGRGCRRITGATVRCTIPKVDELEINVSAGGGDDVVRVTGGGRSVTLAGGDGADRLTAGEGSDILLGEAGADVLAGGAGDDELDGDGPGRGDGIDDPSLVLPAPARDVLDGGTGTDLVGYTGRATPVSVDLRAKTADEDLLSRIEDALGGRAGDVLLGDDGPNVIFASSGADEVDGRGGADVVIGGAVVRGGAGDDVLDGSDARTVRCGPGIDVLDRSGDRLAPADCEFAGAGVTLGRSALRGARGALRLRARPDGAQARRLAVSTLVAGRRVLLGRAAVPKGREGQTTAVAVRLTPAGRRLVAGGRRLVLRADAGSGDRSRVELRARR